MSETPAPDENPLKPVVAKAIHDMKTPISCMRTTVEILRLTTGNPEQQAKSLAILEAQIHDLNTILDKLSGATR